MTHKKIIPNISVDCLVFGFDFKLEQLHIVLKDRKLVSDETGEVIISDYTLTGNHLLENENADEAASRILCDVTGFENILLMPGHESPVGQPSEDFR